MATTTEETVGSKTYVSTTDKVRDKTKTYYILSGWNEQRKATKCTAKDFNDDGSFRSMHDDYWYYTWNYCNTKEQGLKFNIEGITEVDADDYGYMYKEEQKEEDKEDEEKSQSKASSSKGGGGGGCCGGGKACKQDDDGLCGGGNCCTGKGCQSCKVSPACEAETIAKAAATCAQAMATQCINVTTTALVPEISAMASMAAAAVQNVKSCAGKACANAKTQAKELCTGLKGAAAEACCAAAAAGEAEAMAAVSAGAPQMMAVGMMMA